MLAECGRCGWTQEVEDEKTAVSEYARHTIKEHPEAIPEDTAVLMWLQLQVAVVSTTNGRPY